MKRFRNIAGQFNWRFLLVRILVYAVVLLVVTLLPSIWVQPPYLQNFLILAIGLGILNAILRPIIQFLTLSFIFATYGLILIIANTIILYALAVFFPERFQVDGLLWAFVGGAVMGLLSSFLESLFGLTAPILPENEEALRRRVQQQTPGFSRFVLPSIETEEAEEKEAIAAMTGGGKPPSVESPALAGVASATQPAPRPPDEEIELPDEEVGSPSMQAADTSSSLTETDATGEAQS